MRISDWSSDVCSSDLCSTRTRRKRRRIRRVRVEQGRAEIPVAVARARDAVLVEAIAIGPGNHRLFALEDIIAVKREYTVGRPGDVDDLDTLGRQPAKPAAVEDCDLRLASGRTIHHQTIRTGFIPAKHGLDLPRSEEHTSELQSLMSTSYTVF